MRRTALLAAWLLGCAPAFALSHQQANRVHLFNPGTCAQPTGPLWLTIGTGQPAPGFTNITAPAFDEIGALLTGSQPGAPEAALAGQMPVCGVIASFYENANPVGAWVVPPQKLPQLLAILSRNG